jgi:hypothetical protein
MIGQVKGKETGRPETIPDVVVGQKAVRQHAQQLQQMHKAVGQQNHAATANGAPPLTQVVTGIGIRQRVYGNTGRRGGCRQHALDDGLPGIKTGQESDTTGFARRKHGQELPFQGSSSPLELSRESILEIPRTRPFPRGDGAESEDDAAMRVSCEAIRHF